MVGPKGWVWKREILCPSLSIKHKTIQYLASCYTNYATPAPKNSKRKGKNQNNKNKGQGEEWKSGTYILWTQQSLHRTGCRVKGNAASAPCTQQSLHTTLWRVKQNGTSAHCTKQFLHRTGCRVKGNRTIAPCTQQSLHMTLWRVKHNGASAPAHSNPYTGLGWDKQNRTSALYAQHWLNSTG